MVSASTKEPAMPHISNNRPLPDLVLHKARVAPQIETGGNQDPVVDANRVSHHDLQGAVDNAKDEIYLKSTEDSGNTEYFSVDLTMPENKQAIEKMLKQLQNGQSVQLSTQSLQSLTAVNIKPELKPTLKSPPPPGSHPATHIERPSLSNAQEQPKISGRTQFFDAYHLNKEFGSTQVKASEVRSAALNPLMTKQDGSQVRVADFALQEIHRFASGNLRAGHKLDGPGQLNIVIGALHREGVNYNDKAIQDTLGVMFIEDYQKNLDHYQGDPANTPAKIKGNIWYNPLTQTASIPFLEKDAQTPQKMNIEKPASFTGMDHQFRGHQVNALLGGINEKYSNQSVTVEDGAYNFASGNSSYVKHHSQRILKDFLKENPSVPKDSTQWDKSQVAAYQDFTHEFSESYMQKGLNQTLQTSYLNLLEHEMRNNPQMAPEEKLQTALEQLFRFKEGYESKNFGKPNTSSHDPALKNLLSVEDEALLIQALSQFDLAVNILSPEKIKLALDSKATIPADAFVLKDHTPKPSPVQNKPSVESETVSRPLQGQNQPGVEPEPTQQRVSDADKSIVQSSDPGQKPLKAKVRHFFDRVEDLFEGKEHNRDQDLGKHRTHI